MKRVTEEELAKELRQKYIQEPPEGMTSDEVRKMSDDELLDIDYFLHEFDDLDDDDFGEEGLYLLNPDRLFPMPAFRRTFLIKDSSGGGISYKAKKSLRSHDLSDFFNKVF